jgi:hypothetical protein
MAAKLPSKIERNIMHLLLTPMFAIDEMVVPSGAIVIGVLTLLAIIRGK